MNSVDINDYNHTYIAEFLENTAGQHDYITGSVKAIIAQFLTNYRTQMNLRAQSLNQEWWLSSEDIIDVQVEELKRCMIDLCSAKERLTDQIDRTIPEGTLMSTYNE